MLEQGNLFTPRRFEGADQQSKFAELRLETAAEYLEGQGIPPRTDKLLSLDRRILLSSFTPLPMTNY